MPNYLKKIEFIGIHNRFDIIQDFSPGFNILHGVNGSGKTTLIHIITNLVNGDYERFLYIDFFRIRVWYDDGNFITISKEDNIDEHQSINVLVNQDRRGTKINKQINEFFQKSDSDIEIEITKRYAQQPVILPAAYFPAFRTMIEAWQSTEENVSIHHKDKTTKFARKIFGEFTPRINYPSPKDIEQNLITEIQEISNKISLIDRQVMARLSVDFLSTSIKSKSNQRLEKAEALIAKIQSLLEEIQSYPIAEASYISSVEVYRNFSNLLDSYIKNQKKQVSIFLEIYYDALKKIATLFREEYLSISKYLSSVNNFLKGKKIAIFKPEQKNKYSLIKIIFDDGSILNGLDTLSSGERQILTILYVATYINHEKLVLIDEPEISLHIDWQRNLIKKMSQQLNGRQIIVCTHSPMIAADNNRMSLQPKYTNRDLWDLDDSVDEHEISESEHIDEDDFDNYDFIID